MRENCYTPFHVILEIVTDETNGYFQSISKRMIFSIRDCFVFFSELRTACTDFVGPLFIESKIAAILSYNTSSNVSM